MSNMEKEVVVRVVDVVDVEEIEKLLASVNANKRTDDLSALTQLSVENTKLAAQLQVKDTEMAALRAEIAELASHVHELQADNRSKEKAARASESTCALLAEQHAAAIEMINAEIQTLRDHLEEKEKENSTIPREDMHASVTALATMVSERLALSERHMADTADLLKDFHTQFPIFNDEMNVLRQAVKQNVADKSALEAQLEGLIAEASTNVAALESAKHEVLLKNQIINEHEKRILDLETKLKDAAATEQTLLGEINSHLKALATCSETIANQDTVIRTMRQTLKSTMHP